MEFALKGILKRYTDRNKVEISFNVYPHPDHDPGCFAASHSFLRPFSNSHKHACVILDHDGSGQEPRSRTNIETDIEKRLGECGWEGRAAAIAIQPELEQWVWSESPHVSEILGWQDRTPNLKEWLKARGFLTPPSVKPSEPKLAVAEALRIACKGRSSTLYSQLAERVSLDHCTDPAFRKLWTTLLLWFPPREIPGII